LPLDALLMDKVEVRRCEKFELPGPKHFGLEMFSLIIEM
jgi:hypothetical protein